MQLLRAGLPLGGERPAIGLHIAQFVNPQPCAMDTVDPHQQRLCVLTAVVDTPAIPHAPNHATETTTPVIHHIEVRGSLVLCKRYDFKQRR